MAAIVCPKVCCRWFRGPILGVSSVTYQYIRTYSILCIVMASPYVFYMLVAYSSLYNLLYTYNHLKMDDYHSKESSTIAIICDHQVRMYASHL